MGHKHSILKDNIGGLIPKGQVLQHIPTKASCEEAAAMLRNSGVRCSFHCVFHVFSHTYRFSFFFFFFFHDRFPAFLLSTKRVSFKEPFLSLLSPVIWSR